MADRTVKVNLVANASQYIQGINEAAKKTRDLGSEAEKLAQKREAFTALGTAAVAFGALTLTAVGLATKAAMDWESAWTGVTKTVDGSATEMAALEGELRGLAKTLPSTHQEIAAVAEAAGQLGVKRQDVAAFTKTMIDLGETTNLTANDAATQLARFMNVMGTSTSEVSGLGSAIVELGNNYATTEAEILSMGQRLSGAGKQVGLTEGEVLGLATALSSVGIEAEAGGSAISKVMINIASEVETGGDNLETFARVSGMSVKDFSAAWRDDAGSALAAFVSGLSDAEAQGGSTLGVLEELGITEVRMRDALLRSASASDQFTEAMKTGNSAIADNTALTAEAEKRYATTEAQLQIMANKVNDAAITFGAVFLPAIAGVAEALGGLADLLGGMPAPLQGVVGVLAVGAGAVALLGGAALLAVPKVAAFKVALETLGVSGGKATGALRGVASFLTGPWGLAMAVGVTAFAVWNDANNKFQAGAKAIADTLDAQSGAITDNTREYVANRLAQEGAYDAARKVGVSQKELLEAVLEGGDAFDTVNGKLGDYQDSLGGMFDLTTGNGLSAIRGMRREVEESGNTFEDVTAATDDATAAIGDNATALEELQGAAADSGTEVGELAEIIRGFGSATLSARDAERQFQAAIDDLTASVTDNGSSLDINTAAGRANEAALDDIAKAALEAAAATDERGGSEEDARAAVQRGREELIKALAQFGITGAAADAYADKLGLIPSDIPSKATLDTPDAQLNSYITKLNGIPRAFYTTTYLNTVETGTAGRGLGVLKVPGAAIGGAIRGPGSGTSDTAGIYRLSNGEHVWTAAEVLAAGGQSAMYAMRASVRSGGSAAAAPLAQYASAPRGVGYASAAQSQQVAVRVEVVPSDSEFGRAIDTRVFVNGERQTTAIQNRRR